ncbi:MAG: glycosyltransferase [Alphaproteobacteria bacterium]|nr:glycosyltransferase [Alphaproteobacteria bacterium]
MRIILGSLDIGGTERHLAHVLPALVLKGWNIRILTLKAGGALETFMLKQGIEVSSPLLSDRFKYIPVFLVKLLKLLSSIKFLWADFKRYPSQLTHFFLPQAYILGMFAALCARITSPKVMSRRSLNTYQLQYPGIRWIEKKLHVHLLAILANSSAVYDQLRDLENVPVSKLKLIYNGINLEPFQAPLNKQDILTSLNISSSSFIMIIVANLIPYKGHRDLLFALSMISQQLPTNWRLLCVGDPGQIGEELKEQAKALSLNQHIMWLGVRHDVPSLMRISQLGILSSHQEGFANAILEGMAAGLPMVVTNVGGNAEAVIHNKTGLVVPSQNPSALAAAILKLALDGDLARTFGQAGRLRVQENFALETCVEAYDHFYKELNECVA